MTNDIDEWDWSGLSAAERLLLAQDLWESVVSDLDRFPPTDEERRWIDDRLAYARRLDAAWHDWPDAAASARRFGGA